MNIIGISFFFQIRRSISNMDSFYKPYLTTDETRYNELLLVVDFRMVSKKIMIFTCLVQRYYKI